MPNHVTVRFTVAGQPERIRAFVAQARGVSKVTGDEPGSTHYSEKRREHFEFDCLVPLPAEYSTVPYSSSGYDMEIEAWGVKWGAYDIEEPLLQECSATYTFTCAWDAPRVFCEKVSRAWPDLLIVVSYGGEGPIRGHFGLVEGTYLENIAEDPVSSTYPDEPAPTESQVPGWARAALRKSIALGAGAVTRLIPTPRKERVLARLTHLASSLQDPISPEAAEEKWRQTCYEWVDHYLDQHEDSVDSLLIEAQFMFPEKPLPFNRQPWLAHTIDITSPEEPVLLIEDEQGTEYSGQCGGVSCLHPQATGILYHLRFSTYLGHLLNERHHQRWCGSFDEEGLQAIDSYFAALGIPLRTTYGWHEEGWVSVEVQPISSRRWEYLRQYTGQRGILIWNNCD